MAFFVYETFDIQFPTSLIVRTNATGEIFPPCPLHFYLERELLDVLISENAFTPFQVQSVDDVYKANLSIDLAKKQWTLGKPITTDAGDQKRPIGSLKICDTSENWVGIVSTPTHFDVTHEYY